jgi:uncharacterized protein (TIGR02284 family)
MLESTDRPYDAQLNPNDSSAQTHGNVRCVTDLYMSQNKEIISKDGQEGYKQAAEAVKDSELKSLFGSYSQQRSKFASELQNEAVHLGKSKPEDFSSACGSLYRAWINLKEEVCGDGNLSE